MAIARERDYYIEHKLIPEIKKTEPGLARALHNIFYGKRMGKQLEEKFKTKGFWKKIYGILTFSYDPYEEFGSISPYRRKLVIETIKSDLRKYPSGSLSGIISSPFIGDTTDIESSAVYSVLKRFSGVLPNKGKNRSLYEFSA